MVFLIGVDGRFCLGFFKFCLVVLMGVYECWVVTLVMGLDDRRVDGVRF